MALTLVSPPAFEPVSLDEAKLHLRVDIPDDDALIGALIIAAREWCEGFQHRAYISQTWELALDRWPWDHYIRIPLPPLQQVINVQYTDSTGQTTIWDPSNYVVDTRSEPGRVALAYGKVWPPVTLQSVNGVTCRFKAGYVIPFVADPVAGIIKAKAHGLLNGATVRLSNSGGQLPTGLDGTTDYFVINATADTLQLSLTLAGAPVAITSAGTGTSVIGLLPTKVKQAMKLLIAHWYERREPTAVGTITQDLEFTIKSLLWQDRMPPNGGEVHARRPISTPFGYPEERLYTRW